MNVFLGAVGAKITFNMISGIASSAGSILKLVTNITGSSTNGVIEIKKVIKDSDLEVKINTIQLLMREIKINKNSPYTILYCVHSIRNAIHEIDEELGTIFYRMQYNNNLWFGSSFRSYKFNNCKERLIIKIDNLGSRYKLLIDLLTIDHKIFRNDELGCLVSQSVAESENSDNQKTPDIDVHKQIEYIAN